MLVILFMYCTLYVIFPLAVHFFNFDALLKFLVPLLLLLLLSFVVAARAIVR